MNLETGLSIATNDLDFSSIYPSNMRVLNVSRMTLTFVPYEIEGFDHDGTRKYFANLIGVRENASLLCSEYHSLPNYREMYNLVGQQLIDSSTTQQP